MKGWRRKGGGGDFNWELYVAYFELSETLTEKGGKMEESNDQHDSEQENEGKERREGRLGGRDFGWELYYFTETELSETLTGKGGKMEESNDQHDSEQKKEGKERREGGRERDFD